MATTITGLGTTWNTTAGNKTVVATPAVGDLIVVIAAATGAATTAITDTQSGTYVQVDVNRTGFSTSGTLNAWVRTALIPAASSTTFTATQTSSTGGGLTVLSVPGMAVTGTAAVRSSGGQSSGTAGTTPTPVLSSTPLDANPIIAAVANGSSPAGITQRFAYSEVTDLGYSTPTSGFEVSTFNAGESTATLNHGGTSATAFASIALELQYNTPPTVALNSPANAGTVSTTTPQLTFTGTDADAPTDTITYNVQVDTANTFDSVTGSPATPAFVQTKSANGSNGIPTVTLTSPATAGNLLVATIVNASTTAAPTLSGWTALTTGVGVTATRMFYKTAAGGETTISGATGSSWGMIVNEYSGATSLLAENATNSAASTTYTTPTVTPASGNNALIVYSLVSNSAGTWSNDSVNGSSTGVTSRNSTNNGISYTLRCGDKVVTSTTATYNASATNSSSATGNEAIAIFLGQAPNTPAIDKVSGIDTGFIDITNGAHSNPFTSGEQIGYTLQSALTNGSTYYWRVRGKDVNGSNGYGAWATTRSFTVSTGPGAVTAVGLSDNFDDNSIDTTKWPSNFNNAGNTVAETGGAGVITLGGTSGSYSAYYTSATYDLTSHYAQLQAVTVPPDAATNSQAYLKLELDSSNYIVIGKSAGNLYMQRLVAGVDSTTNTAYDTTNHAWWRLVESSGTTYWQTSPDGATWSTVRSMSNPFAMTALKVQIGAGTFATQASAGTFTFDNFNTSASTTPTSLFFNFF